MPARTMLTIAAVLTASSALGQQRAPFKGGFPSPEQAQESRDHTDFQRAVTAYRFWYPTVSCEGIFNGGRAIGIKDSENLMIMSAGKGWFTYFRIYGPEAPAFDGSWKPGDFEEVKELSGPRQINN
jgi:hypothetical protein